MNTQASETSSSCPEVDVLSSQADETFKSLKNFCLTSEMTFCDFQKSFAKQFSELAVCLFQMFLVSSYLRLQLDPFFKEGYRLSKTYSKRTLKTIYGLVTYGRHYLKPLSGGIGFFPLDVVLGLTGDSITPWVRQLLARFATRMSYKSVQRMFKAVFNWAPSVDTIERIVLGLGEKAKPFMEQLPAPEGDGEVLVIEMDGKCPPTATEEELAKRRGKRQPKHHRKCKCGCQRHRGKAKRQSRGSKKRRKKGDKSKNGREVTVLVMYTLKKGSDGKLHGPINKKIYGTFTGRKAGALWAREEATKRGFGPETTKTIQIIMDGALGLKENMQKLFPKAIITLDVCHVIEKLWSLGLQYFESGSEELKIWVEELKKLVYQGQIKKLVKHLKKLLENSTKNGPGTKSRRVALKSIIGYLESRIEMMRYGEWLEKDLVIASGQVEGTVRNLVGERFDCSGMRWIPGKAEALLHLRCIELNGDWEKFDDWFQCEVQNQLKVNPRFMIHSNEPIPLSMAA